MTGCPYDGTMDPAAHRCACCAAGRGRGRVKTLAAWAVAGASLVLLVGGAAGAEPISLVFRTPLRTYSTDGQTSQMIGDPNGRLRVAMDGAAAAAVISSNTWVQGTNTDGTAAASAPRPVGIAGYDSTGVLQQVLTDANGGVAITTSNAGAGAITASTPRVVTADDSGVELVDSASGARASILTADPIAGSSGVVVRPAPSDLALGGVELIDSSTGLRASIISTTPTGAESAFVVRALTSSGAAATQVQGTVNDGLAEVGNPVQVGGVDSAGVAQALLVSSDGAVAIFDSGNVISVDDAAGSLTVDAPVGTPVAVRIGDSVDQVLVTAAGELNVLATAQPGVDVGDVTINNGAAGAAVNVQDGGNVLSVDDAAGSLTVDSAQLPAALVGGRLDVVIGAALPAGAANIGDVDVLTINGVAPAFGAGATGATVLRVDQANDGAAALSLDDIEAAVELIDNAVFAEDAAHVSIDSGIAFFAVRVADTNSLVGSVGDYNLVTTDSWNALRTSQDGWAPIASDFVNLAADIQGVAGAAGLRLGQMSIRNSGAGTVRVLLRHGTSTAGPVIPGGHINLAADESVPFDWGASGGLLIPSGLFIDIDAADPGTVDVTFSTQTRTP